MYTASQYEFRSFPDIRRNSPPPTLKTEDAPTRWLNGELISLSDINFWDGRVVLTHPGYTPQQASAE